MKVTLLVLCILVATSLSGCFGLFGEEDGAVFVDDDSDLIRDRVDDRQRDRIDALASDAPRAYTFPNQAALPPATTWFNDSVGVDANLAIEGANNKGGTNFGSIYRFTDVAAFVPPGQPTEIKISLWWDGQEARSMDFDIFVDVPGLKTSRYEKSEELNWNIPTKSMTVNTIGVAGANHFIGVEANNGRTTGDVPFTMRIDFSYERNVLTPYHPWAFHVPANASGIVVESAKAGGSEDVAADFLVIGPDDRLVAHVSYNDFAIPTESMFIPLPGPGEYVFYAHAMRGGFLRLAIDVALERVETRALARIEETTFLVTSPAPGIAGRDWLNGTATGVARTEITGGEEIAFNVEGPFPLSVRAVIDASSAQGLQGMVHARVASAKGIVHDLERILRYDDETRGSLGYSGDEGQANRFDAARLDKGSYTLTVVNNSSASVGYSIITYKR